MTELRLQSAKEKYQQLARLLQDEYGYPSWRQHHPPVDELILTILSQNTSDVNSFRAFGHLKEKYDSWEKVRTADLDELKETIRPAGLANQKAPRIQRSLNRILDERGEISLDFLKDMTVPDAKAWLTSIKGIGNKTASIILLFSLNMPAFPVDTHVFRVTKRLGLHDTSTPDKAHYWLEDVVEPKDYYAFHLQIIQHGREVCHARTPKCSVCVLQNECDYFNAGVGE